MPHEQEIAALAAEIKEHVLYMQELGVTSLDAAMPEASGFAPSQPTRSIPAPEEPPQRAAPPAELPAVLKKPQTAASKPKAGSRIKALPSLGERPVYSRTPAKLSSPPLAEIPAAEPSDVVVDETAVTIPATAETISDIRLDIGNCVRCPLHQGRTQIVHTTGNFTSKLMFVGEAPGADEDAKGEPFVGRAGKLLTQIIEAIGFRREDVVIGNINRCRPPGNRQPTLPEAHTCRPFLMREIAVIKPKVIVVLGNTALHNLLDTKIGITKMRGQFHDYFNVKVMPTFHPAYLLRDPNKKREVWEDMKLVRDYLASLE